MADESSDVSNIVQLVICICWVDKEITECEEYFGLMRRSDKCIYNYCLHQRCAAAYESQNSRCSWAVLCWKFDHDWNQNGVAVQIKILNGHTATDTHLILLSGIQ